ncbi:MAG: ABC transporter ATP-binding protein [Acidimicrobiales bacterium]|jgi:ABC-type lipoprotein export system ATPase subunit
MNDHQVVSPALSSQDIEPTGNPVQGAHVSALTSDDRSNAEKGKASLAIEAIGVTKEFDGGTVRALNGVDLRVERGEFIAIMGPSGCGKSTLLHLLAALDSPTSGTIRVEGKDLAHLSNPSRYRRQTIGLIFQLHNLLPRLSALANIEVAMMGSHRPHHERTAKARQLLAELDIVDREHRHPPQLSGGERQRVAIARALANDPAVLLADEPTGNLDSDASAIVLGLFARVQREYGATTVMVTHDAAVAQAAGRILQMQDGRIGDRSGA